MRRTILPLLLLVAALVVGATATASHEDPGAPSTALNVQPVQMDGNLTCAQAMSASAFLFEVKQEPVSTQVINVNQNGVAGTISITKVGDTFNFALTGNVDVAGVFVKGGSNGNLYDYRALAPVSGDTGLHAPINPANSQFYGLSHISFCVVERGTTLDVDKTPDGGSVALGDDVEFEITVTNTGTVTAKNVTLDDVLPAGFAWTDDSADCTIGGAGGNELHCDVGDLAAAASFGVTVSAATTAAHCGPVSNPAANADADNAARATDSGSTAVECGRLRLEKVTDPSGSAQAFDFTAPAGLSDVTGLKDGDGPSAYQTVAPGTYTFAEQAVDGWTMTGVQCAESSAGAGEASSGDPAARTVTFNVQDGEDVTCTVTNTQNPDGPPPPPPDDPPIQQVAANVVSPPPPVQQVAAQRARPGAARLAGPTRCVRRPFTVRVAGSQIRSLAFFVDNRRVQTLRAPRIRAAQAGQRQVFRVRIDPRRLRGGVHRLRVRVAFQPASRTRARTLRLAFQRCPLQRVQPRFTG